MIIDDNKLDKLKKLYIAGVSRRKAQKEMGCSYNTIKKYFTQFEEDKDDPIIVEAKEVREKEHRDILEMIKSNSMATIMSDAMSMLDKETLKREQEKGIQPLTNLIGMIADKALKMENIKLQHENAKLKHEILDKTRHVVFVDDEDEFDSDNIQLS